MASLHRILLTVSGTKADFQSKVNLSPGGLDALQQISQFFDGIPAGALRPLVGCAIGAVQAVGSFTQTSTGAANGETLTVAGVTFTARTSGAVGNEWNRNNTVATSATNLAAAINASTATNIYCSAVAAAGVVTITVTQPGVLGNLLALTESCSNTTTVTCAGGTEGTATSLDYR